jgi:hypothetical protein
MDSTQKYFICFLEVSFWLRMGKKKLMVLICLGNCTVTLRWLKSSTLPNTQIYCAQK